MASETVGGGYEPRYAWAAIQVVIADSSDFLMAFEGDRPVALNRQIGPKRRMMRELSDARASAEGEYQERHQEVGSPTQHALIPPEHKTRTA